MIKAPKIIEKDGVIYTFDFMMSSAKDGDDLVYRDPKERLHIVNAAEVVKNYTFEVKVPKTKVVQQGKYDCAAASLSQLFEVPLFFVKRAMAKHHWRNDDKGATNQVIALAARDLGFDLIDGGRKTIRALRDSFPPASLSVRSLNYPKMGHAITWVNDEIIDPNFGRIDRKTWDANWCARSVDAYWAQFRCKRPLSQKLHKELEELRMFEKIEVVRKAILELAS